MALNEAQFRTKLYELIENRQSGPAVGLHKVFNEGLTLERLRNWAQQWYLQVRLFPAAISAIHAQCPHLDARTELAENIYEEDTGRISGTAAHPELFLRFAEAIGLSRQEMETTEPAPGTAALLHWMEYSTKQLSWLEGAAVINVAFEARPRSTQQQVGDPYALTMMQERLGLSSEALTWFRLHSAVDAEHGESGISMVCRYARSDQEQEQAVRAIQRTYQIWELFWDDLERRYLAE